MRLKIRLSLVIITAIGYALKYYQIPGDEFINNLAPASVARNFDSCQQSQARQLLQ